MIQFCFVNGAPRKMLLVIEPRSSEFWIKSKSTVEVSIEGGGQHLGLDVEYLPNGLVIYVEAGQQVIVREEGRLLSQGKQSARLGRRLNMGSG